MDKTTLEIPMVCKLGTDGPIPKALRERLDTDLNEAQSICLGIQEICGGEISRAGHDAELVAHLQAVEVAQRIFKSFFWNCC